MVVEGFIKFLLVYFFLCIDVLFLCLVRFCLEMLVLIKNIIKIYFFNYLFDLVFYYIFIVKFGLDFFLFFVLMWILFFLCDNVIGNLSFFDV